MSDNEFSNLYNTRVANPQQPTFDENKSICIKNISNLTRQDIIDFLKPCHPIIKIHIKGNFGYVQFKDSKLKELALRMNHLVYKGNTIFISSIKKSVKL
ncbi:hypothetical protein H311_00164 [Anncaliia algerae PRA109]|nr:hypothetical protein H311_01858 [Anncaliia algerae PRA109]KCZ78249.1 hypothetical protein H311_00725 [Anncaliia algerae PRA109]KCZ78637.1 hypothetical protein H311_00325 [Anncaliia algerae PRA109]KCZ78798.1 hypothetical protein H311_00164 [Anncaliia algerae PRA109]